MAPLSGKQQREYLKFQNKEAREASKMGLDEMRKQQLHELKLQEAAAKANQGLGHKEQVNNAKLKDMGIPPPRMNKQKLGIPTQNPLAGTGMFKQGQRNLPQPMFQAQGTDTVPAMLTPGEAVIPRAAAQNPKNKKAIKRMVQEGRKANMRDGAVDVRYSDAPGQAKYHMDGTSSVPSLAYRHPDVPGSSFMHGTMSVPDFSRGSSTQANYANGTYGVVPQQVQSAAGYADGIEEVETDNLLSRYPVPIDQQYIVPKPLLNAQILQESGGVHIDPKTGQLLRSKAGAEGIAQILRSTAASPGYGVKPLSEEDFANPDKQKEFQQNYMNAMSRKYTGDIQKSLTAYNAGPGTVDKAIAMAEKAGKPAEWQSFLPTTEAKEYVGKVMGRVAPIGREPIQTPGQRGDAVMTRGQAGAYSSAPAQPVTNNEVSRVDMLKRIIAGPYPANEKGQARLELERLTSTTPPKPSTPLEREWAASNKDNLRPEVVKEVARIEAAPTTAVVPEKVTTEVVPKPEDMSKNQQAFTNDRDYNMAISQYSQSVAPQIEEVKTQSESIKDPVERKSFLERALSSLFGESGLFSDKELMRFAIVGAGGMLTGGSVGGSLRFAARDVLQSADRRQAQESVEAREDKRLKAQDDRLLEGKLIDQGYNVANVKKFLKTNKQEDLGEAKVIYAPAGTSATMTAASGPLYGKPITIRKENIITGKQKGGIREIAVVDGKEYDVAALSKVHPLVPYSDAQHGSRAVTERFVKTITDSTKTADAVLEQAFGAENVRGKKNPDRQGIPTGREISNQGYSYLRSHGYNADNPDEVQEMNNLFSQATRDMIADKKNNKLKEVSSIEPYLARNIIQHRTGLDSSLLSIGDKPMNPEKIVNLDLAASAYARDSEGKVNQEKKVKLLNEIAKDWKNPNSAKLRDRYQGTKDETAFYMFAVDELKKLNKQNK